MTKIPPPQAIGWIEAQIVDLDGQRAKVLFEDGTKIPCLLPGNPDKIRQLCEPGKKVLTVYPGASKNKLYFKVVRLSDERRKNVGRFFVRGIIKQNKDGLMIVLVFSERFRKHYPIAVNGFVQAKLNEYWNFEAALEDGQLALVDGEKLSDRYDISALTPAVTVFENIAVAEPLTGR